MQPSWPISGSLGAGAGGHVPTSGEVGTCGDLWFEVVTAACAASWETNVFPMHQTSKVQHHSWLTETRKHVRTHTHTHTHYIRDQLPQFVLSFILNPFWLN